MADRGHADLARGHVPLVVLEVLAAAEVAGVVRRGRLDGPAVALGHGGSKLETRVGRSSRWVRVWFTYAVCTQVWSC